MHALGRAVLCTFSSCRMLYARTCYLAAAAQPLSTMGAPQRMPWCLVLMRRTHMVCSRQQVTCYRLLRDDELPEPEEHDDAQDGGTASAGGARSRTHTQKASRRGAGARPKVAVNLSIESLSAESAASAEDGGASGAGARLVAGTSDGRMLVLKLVLDKGKPVCRLLHDVAVLHGGGEGGDAQRGSNTITAPVTVLAIKDKLVAAVSSKGAASLNVYNLSRTGGRAAREPILLHYVPLDLPSAASAPAPLLVCVPPSSLPLGCCTSGPCPSQLLMSALLHAGGSWVGFGAPPPMRGSLSSQQADVPHAVGRVAWRGSLRGRC